jgi:hypothetical protein
MQLVLSSVVLRHVMRFADGAAQRMRPLTQALVNFYRGLEDGWMLQGRYEALARLSGCDLARRGLRRDEIAQAALSYVERYQR